MVKVIKEMNFGDNGVALYVVDVKESNTKTNSKYLRVTLRDIKKKEIVCNYWGMSLATSPVEKNKVYEMVVNKGTYNGGDSYTVVSIKSVLNDISEYVNDMTAHTDMMNDYFQRTIQSIEDEKIKQFACIAYSNMVEEGFLRGAAAKTMHHNYLGGLAYHTYGMVKLAEAIAASDKRVNRDILITGCLIHDMGKLVELKTDDKGVIEYTVDGRLRGHVIIGEAMLRDFASGVLDEDTTMHLSHIMLSHHGKLEWGSPVEPKTLEAFLVHQIDLIDSRKEMFCREYETMDSKEMSEKKVLGLDGNYIYKP